MHQSVSPVSWRQCSTGPVASMPEPLIDGTRHLHVQLDRAHGVLDEQSVVATVEFDDVCTDRGGDFEVPCWVLATAHQELPARCLAIDSTTSGRCRRGVSQTASYPLSAAQPAAQVPSDLPITNTGPSWTPTACWSWSPTHEIHEVVSSVPRSEAIQDTARTCQSCWSAALPANVRHGGGVVPARQDHSEPCCGRVGTGPVGVLSLRASVSPQPRTLWRAPASAR